MYTADEKMTLSNIGNGAAWKLTAIQRIKAWFQDRLPDIPIIA